MASPFNKDSPMSPQSAGSNISYQTNVNRQKTRKWAEAKPVSYGGDDWGDDDEYDGYDLPPLPAPAKPTGIRQPGQGIQNAPSPMNDSRRYGELPALPGASNSRPRANSFDADDEKRNFSSASLQPAATSIAGGPPTRFSQITGVPTVRAASGPPTLHIHTQQPSQLATGLRKPSITLESHPELSRPARVNTGESPVMSPSDIRTPSTASVDYQARRDYSPSAVPPPLSTTRVTTGSHTTADSTATRYPARKSSLSHVFEPAIAGVTGSPAISSATPKQVASPPPSSGSAARSPTTPTGKSLPFVRPSDIYKRAEEERRQSQESVGRPDIGSLMGYGSGDRSDSPGKDTLKSVGRRNNGFDGTNDLGDGGRGLRPDLEPIRERKSEYGFDGLNINDHAATQAAESGIEGNREDDGHLATSPKLPNLTRLSGLNLDMFSDAHSGEQESVAKDDQNTTEPSTATLSSADDLELRNKPSFGFRSVVNQAFDRSDDSSVPPTPASRTGSGVRRTDSESTGTTGISPIMSRVPSAANPDARNRDVTPSILEVVNEPSSPDTPSRDIPGFKPGHRRDISVPSPGNSPSRTPDIEASKIITHGSHANVAEASDDDSETLQPPRPIAERESTFRPSLPGGWTSYATTARSETPTQTGGSGSQTHASVAENQGEERNELTPTTTKQSLSHSITGPAAGFGLAGAAGAALDRHEIESPARTPVSEIAASYNRLPTPDISMAPSGSVYSRTALDPRLMPKLEQAPPETQLRPDMVNRQASADSIAGPTPPLKDTPVLGPADSHDYFPTMPQPHELGDTDAKDGSQALRPEMLPSLSTDTRLLDEDNDDENERLRQEIVKSLSSRPSNLAPRDELLLDGRGDNSSMGGQSRQSTYLPQEYDNYWADTGDNVDGAAESGLPPMTEGGGPVELEALDTPPSSSIHKQSNLEPPRPALGSRFSWEHSSENMARDLSRGETPHPASEGPASEMPQELAGSTVEFDNSISDPRLSRTNQTSTSMNPNSPDSNEAHHVESDATAVAGAAVGFAAVVGQGHPPGQSQRRVSLAEEKDSKVSSHPVSPTPPEDEHPSKSPQPYITTEADQSSLPGSNGVSPIASPVMPQFSSTTTRLLAFKEIAAMKTPHERIKTYDETRHRFAAMDSGLGDWLSRLQSQYPEHASASGTWGGPRLSMPSTSTRSKFAAKVTGQPAQQPYYQQYLNASSPTMPSTPVTHKPGPGLSMQSGSQQGFSPAGGKITSEQAKAKGKELLHTAGIFGGKAGKAGKGLLAKGKNRLRGGDKTSPPSKPKPTKNDRRSSWGLPLSLSRSSGRPGSSAYNSNEGTPVPLKRARASTMTMEGASSALPSVAFKNEALLGTGTQAFLTPMSQITSHTPRSTIRQVTDPDTVSDLEEEDAELNERHPPFLASEAQNTGDQPTATPIADEDGFQREGPRLKQYSQEPTAVQDALEVLTEQAVGSSTRSNSDAFYDAPEEPHEQPDDTNGWVMVSPNNESKSELVIAKSLFTPGAASPAPESEGAADGVVEISQRHTLHHTSRRSVSRLEPEYSEVLDVLKTQHIQPTEPINERGSVLGNYTPYTHVLQHSGPALASNGEPETREIDSGQHEGAAVRMMEMPQTRLEPASQSQQAVNNSENSHPVANAKINADPSIQMGLCASEDSMLQNASISNDTGEVEAMKSPASSIMSRPRGSFDMGADPTSPDHIRKFSFQSATRPTIPVQPAAFTLKTQPQVDPERQTTTSSFLPPIRRTSTFGLGFGSRHARPRFPISDDEEDVVDIPENYPDISMEIPHPKQQDMLERYTQHDTSIQAQAPVGPATPNRPKSLQETVLPVQQSASAQHGPDLLAARGLAGVSASNAKHDFAHEEELEVPPSAPAGRPATSREEKDTEKQFFNQDRSREASREPVQLQPLQQVERLPPIRTTSPGQRNRTIQPTIVAPRASDVLQRPEFRESQVEWRPKRPKMVPTTSTESPSYYKETGIPAPRNSWEPQRPRGYSGSSSQGSYGSYEKRPNEQTRSPWSGGSVQRQLYEQPPSSAQRYPDLFRPGQIGNETPTPPNGCDLPAHLYQGPISREAAFMPRQQISEYQIPGVGPPVGPPRSAHSRRNSGSFLKEIGGKLSRASSRDKRSSIIRDDVRERIASPTPPAARQLVSRGDDYTESSGPSEGEQERKKKRRSFFGNLNRASASGLSAPKSRESVIAHNADSRTDFMGSSSRQESPAAQERSKSFFGHSAESKKTGKLARASTTMFANEPPEKKGNRFSSMGGLFGKSNPSSKSTKPVSEQSDGPFATRELSHNDRQAIETPPLGSRRASYNTSEHFNPNQSRNFLSRLSSSQSPRTDSRQRRPSAAGLFGGLVGRRPRLSERESDDSRSQGSQPQVPQAVPPPQTYTDLQEEYQQHMPEQQEHLPPPPEQSREISFQDASMRPDRGRRVSREPQYDSVPIPDGYQLVRGQGATAVPTDYDPRGLNRAQQIDSRFGPNLQNHGGAYQPNSAQIVPHQGQLQIHHYQNGAPYVGQEQQVLTRTQHQGSEPQLKVCAGAMDTYHQYALSSSRRISREDLLARSPPKSPEGQQRPFQLTLPGVEDENSRLRLRDNIMNPATDLAPLDITITNSIGRKQAPTSDAIQRLQQAPVLRHPESPAGYPLPDDTVFSPIDPEANNVPPPPPPKWPSQSGAQDKRKNTDDNSSPETRHERHASLTPSMNTMEMDLDRSNTRRTAVSAISGISAPQAVAGALSVPSRDSTVRSMDRPGANGQGQRISPSPTPPSPMGGSGSERQNSNRSGRSSGKNGVFPDNNRAVPAIKTTEVMARGSSPDLYNASPRFAKPPPYQPESSNRHSNSNENRNPHLNGHGVKLGNETTVFSDAEHDGTTGRHSHEEKIPFHDAQERIDGDRRRSYEGLQVDEPEPATMSATSYPGQEWNPYGAGNWEEGFD